MMVDPQHRTASRDGEATWWRQLPASIAPNPRVLLLVGTGWATELVLLGRVNDNVYHVSTEAL